jgi:septum site-determining protein MinD
MPQQERKSQIIAIFATKGGVGKTLISTNLAVSLCLKGDSKKVALFDFDLQVGQDMAKMLGLTANSSLADKRNQIEALSQEQAEEFFKGHFLQHASGISFLPAILRPQQARYIEPDFTRKFFELLRGCFDFIVIDAGRDFNDSLITIFDSANLILLVVTPDILSVYQAKRNLEVLESLRFPLKMIKVVLNRAESRGGVRWQEVRAILPCDIISQIPSEGKAVGWAINRGVPVVMESPRSRISDAIGKLAQVCLEDESLFLPQQMISHLRLEEESVARVSPESFWGAYGFGEIQEVKAKAPSLEDEIVSLKKRVHKHLIEELDLKKLDLEATGDPVKARQLRDRTEKVISNLIAQEAGGLISNVQTRERLIKEIADEALGLGPLEDLLRDSEITEIMVNNKDQVYIERHGKLELTDKKFISNDQVRTIIEKIVAPLGRRIDESVPMVDARLPDGSRVNAIIPPLSLTGPMLTIRKFGKERLTIDDLIKLGTLSEEMAAFLRAAVLSRKNVIVSGGTGSGKTTILNVLSAFIPDGERIITIEDSAELKLRQRHWGRLEARPPNIEGKGAITVRDLFRNSLRMRPDRIIIGECRGGETLDMLQAMNTGHDGSLTTVHANSTYDVISRLDSMVLMSGIELPVRSIREQIASAVDLIVHSARLSDGSRKILQITEITGMKSETGIAMEDIFVFRQTGLNKDGRVLGEFIPTGFIPSFYNELKVRGISLPEDIFKPPAKAKS